MSKKYLYIVRAENCEVTFPKAEHSIMIPVGIFNGTYEDPAVYTNSAAAEKFCSKMNNNHPNTPYTVHKFLPQS